MKTKTNLSLVELFSGVPMFAKMLEVLKSKQFIIPENPPKDEHTTIGVMSPLERACYAVLDSPEDKIKSLGVCPIGHLDSGCMNAVMVELDFCPFAKQLLAIREEYPHQKGIHNLMFGLIQSRMQKNHSDLENISLTEGFRIMTSTKMNSPETIEVFEGIENMSVEEMIKVSFQNTFMESVIATFETGKFVDESSPIKDGEIFIREMTTFEKALWTVYSTLFDEKKAKIQKLEKLMEGDAFHTMGMSISLGRGSSSIGMIIAAEKGHSDVIEAEKLEQEISSFDAQLQPLDSLFWSVVRSTSKEKHDMYDTTGVRKGFKIVMFDED